MVSKMVKAVFDTNIIIDYLNGIPQAAKEFNYFKQRSMSIITYIEVLVGLRGKSLDQIARVKAFLESFEILEVGHIIADLSISARQEYALKVPDAIIFATAQSISALLVTRNTKDFLDAMPMVRVPYHL